MPGDIWEIASGQFGLQSCQVYPEEGGRFWGKWSFGVNEHRTLSVRLRNLGRVHSGGHEELGEGLG